MSKYFNFSIIYLLYNPMVYVCVLHILFYVFDRIDIFDKFKIFMNYTAILKMNSQYVYP